MTQKKYRFTKRNHAHCDVLKKKTANLTKNPINRYQLLNNKISFQWSQAVSSENGQQPKYFPKKKFSRIQQVEPRPKSFTDFAVV